MGKLKPVDKNIHSLHFLGVTYANGFFSTFFSLAETKVVLIFVRLGVLSLETQVQGIQQIFIII